MGQICGSSIASGVIYAIWAWLLSRGDGGPSGATRLIAAVMTTVTCSAMWGASGAAIEGGGFPGPIDRWAVGSAIYAFWAFAWAGAAHISAAQKERAKKP